MDIFMIVLLAIVGVVLMVVEAFMPGFGIPGLSGIVLEIIAIAICLLSLSSVSLPSPSPLLFAVQPRDALPGAKWCSTLWKAVTRALLPAKT